MNLQAEYDNRARVPDSADILARWSRDAAAFRTTWARSHLDVPYGPGERERLDLFLPEGAAEATPLVMFIHGGYWQALDHRQVSHFARGLLLRGVAVAVPSYGLCPEVPIATAVEQLRKLAAMLCLQTKQHVYAMGHSAGGQLAAMLLGHDYSRFSKALGCQVVPGAMPISGVFEIEPLLGTTIGAGLGLTAEEARALSPRFLPPPGGELHAVVGAAESPEYLRQTRDFAEAWGGTHEAIPDANHFTVLDPLADPDHPLTIKAAGTARRLASL
ncbi:alpha/beta hydrolase [Roseomonas sp. HF4]|uniref:alpha/beta hydrolase n=1 Tax=Roseomonas sp. HF4 TaxID=2562313 RepID=UPI0010BFDEDF|nr:alpha/beta hydrolase [Roseomonas sp. HF4]